MRQKLWRIANEDHSNITLGEGDLVIFSSRIIPGNEASIGRLHNQLVRRGILVIDATDHFVHVSVRSSSATASLPVAVISAGRPVEFWTAGSQ